MLKNPALVSVRKLHLSSGFHSRKKKNTQYSNKERCRLREYLAAVQNQESNLHGRSLGYHRARPQMKTGKSKKQNTSRKKAMAQLQFCRSGSYTDAGPLILEEKGSLLSIIVIIHCNKLETAQNHLTARDGRQKN